MVELMVILHINLHITYRKSHITLHTHIYILISIRTATIDKNGNVTRHLRRDNFSGDDFCVFSRHETSRRGWNTRCYCGASCYCHLAKRMCSVAFFFIHSFIAMVISRSVIVRKHPQNNPSQRVATPVPCQCAISSRP